MGEAYDYNSIRRELVSKNELFEDVEFPASLESLCYSRRLEGVVQWLRPKDVIKNPKLIVDGPTNFELEPGLLGNTWLAAAEGCLAIRPTLFAKVVPRNQKFDTRYAGVFHFFFWRYGEWKEVVIDDRVPILQIGGDNIPLYIRNKAAPNEFWPALLEKAYAKLNGSYEAIEDGRIQDALVDFTGGVSEVQDMMDKAKVPQMLFQYMWRMDRMNSIMSCHITPPNVPRDKKPSGLYTGHAYALLKIVKTPVGGKMTRLVKLKNPFGKAEWNGAWCCASKEWHSLSEYMKDALELTVLDDSEFWMAYEDFENIFNELQTVHLTPHSSLVALGKTSWDMVNKNSSWIKGLTAGGCGNPPFEDLYWTNPQYKLIIREKDEDDEDNRATVVVSLMQKHRPPVKSSFKQVPINKAIGIDLYRIRKVKQQDPPQDDPDGEHKEEEVVDMVKWVNTLELVTRMTKYSLYREVTCRYHLELGTYCIVPSTYYPQENAEFYMRVVTENPVDVKEVDAKTRIVTPIRPPVKNGNVDVSVLKAIYDKMQDSTGRIDAHELCELLTQALVKTRGFSKEVSLESSRSLLALMDTGMAGTINLEDVYQLWVEMMAYEASYKKIAGSINKKMKVSDLKQAFDILEIKASRLSLSSVCLRYAKKDGTISFDDFLTAASRFTYALSFFGRRCNRDMRSVMLNVEEWMCEVLRL